MRYIAAYMLAQLGGHHDPTPKDIEKIITSVGIECDKKRAEKVCNDLKGKKLEDLIAKGFLVLFFYCNIGFKIQFLYIGRARLGSVAVSGGAAPAAEAKGGKPEKGGKKDEKKEEAKPAAKKEERTFSFNVIRNICSCIIYFCFYGPPPYSPVEYIEKVCA